MMPERRPLGVYDERVAACERKELERTERATLKELQAKYPTTEQEPGDE